MPTNLDIHVNTSNTDLTRVSIPASYELVDIANDKLIWTAGGLGVTDGDDTPTNTELDDAATIIQTSDVEIARLFLLDFSDVGQELKEINTAGSVVDTQYVINFSFDGPTVTEPTLESYDDNSHSSANLLVLGNGTPADSMIRAVLTTAGLPGINWVGTAIAGSTLPNILQLNAGGGGLVGAEEIYVNLKVVVPASFPSPFSENPVLTVRYTFI